MNLNIFLKIIHISYDNVFEVFLNQIYSLDREVEIHADGVETPLSPEQKEQRIQELKDQRIQELKDQCISYIRRLALVHQVHPDIAIYPDLATNIINNQYQLRNNFLRAAIDADPSRGALTDREHRVRDITLQAHLRVKRMGFLLKVINEWNRLQANEKKNIKENFLMQLNLSLIHI